jgi:hypothetical protein
LNDVDHSARPPKTARRTGGIASITQKCLGESSGDPLVLKDVTGMDLPPPARKTIDLEGRLVKGGVRTALRDRQEALSELVEAIRKYQKLAEKTPLTLQGADFAQAVDELTKVRPAKPPVVIRRFVRRLPERN